MALSKELEGLWGWEIMRTLEDPSSLSKWVRTDRMDWLTLSRKSVSHGSICWLVYSDQGIYACSKEVYKARMCMQSSLCAIQFLFHPIPSHPAVPWDKHGYRLLVKWNLRRINIVLRRQGGGCGCGGDGREWCHTKLQRFGQQLRMLSWCDIAANYVNEHPRGEWPWSLHGQPAPEASYVTEDLAQSWTPQKTQPVLLGTAEGRNAQLGEKRFGSRWRRAVGGAEQGTMLISAEAS